MVKILESNVSAEWYKVEAGTKTGYVRLYVDIDASLPLSDGLVNGHDL
ncbi:MAG: hypothetical protein R2912_02725 [Eubacteriales bacterium]